MAVTRTVSIAARVIALTIALFVCYAFAGASLGMQDQPQAPEEAATAGLALLAVCLLQTLVLTHIILRSRWSGWQLIGAVAFVYYGVTTFMAQIESAVFITRLPAGMLPRLFLMGALIAVPFSIIAVLMLGKRQRSASDAESNGRAIMARGEWAWKLALLVSTYVVLYFTFGYFIAWKNPAVLQYYNGIDEGRFFTHMRTVVTATPWLIPFQALRALLWIALALPVIRMMKGRRPEIALAVGALFSIVMNAQLLLPNPYMPYEVRMTHLVETASSNLLFGLLVGWLLAGDRRCNYDGNSTPRAVAVSSPTDAARGFRV